MSTLIVPLNGSLIMGPFRPGTSGLANPAA
jgi:hypothetical protein